MNSQDPEMEMDSAEIQSFIRVWFLAITSQFYCYFVASRIPSGLTRLLSLLPVVYLFIALPFSLSSFHLAAPTACYLVWLGNFKLLLFSFDQGPLSSRHPPLSLLRFICVALLPIKTKTNPSSSSASNPTLNAKTINNFNVATFAIKSAFLIMIISIYSQREHLHQSIILALYCCHVYLGVELILAISAVPVRVIPGLEIEPQFNEPYLATSLQDFWGRRWNLVVTSILRPTVYNPIRSVCTPVLGRDRSSAAAVLATFLVSGLMHEILYYYMTRARPTWEVTWFFVLHGLCVAAEIAVKKACRWRLHGALSGPITIGFVGFTGAWLFFPQVLRSGLDLKAINEYYVLFQFVREKLNLELWSNT